MIRCLASLGVIVSVLSGQVQRSGSSTRAEPDARIEGQVLSDVNGLPLAHAHVTLRPVDGGNPAVGTDADEHGNFALRKIASGRYSLVAEHDGYLATVSFRRGALRMPPFFDIVAGDKVMDIVFRLRPWAVLSGKVKLDDAEPGVGVRVELYREYRDRGRHTYGIVSGAFTNDRGEYRVYGLPPGAYYVAAVYSRTPSAANYQEQTPTDAQGRELPVTGYSTTFFPNTEKLSEALPVRLESGQERAGIDFNMRRVPMVKMKGQVISGISGIKLSSAVIALSQADASTEAAVQTPARATFDRQGDFEIANVPPGVYIITVQASDSGKTLSGRRVLTLSRDGEEKLELLATPPMPWTGTIVLAGADRWPAKTPPRVTLQPRSDSGVPIQVAVKDLLFDCVVERDETYDVLVENLADDFYVSAVRAGGSDQRTRGLPGNLASPLPFEIVLDSRGGRVSGSVVGPDGSLWSGASLALIPEPPQGRLQDYRESSANRFGQFQIRGVAPGKYTLVAWMDDPPCEIYDGDSLGACRASGVSVAVEASGEQSLIFNVKASPTR